MSASPRKSRPRPLDQNSRHWLNDPQKLLQLIAAAEGAKSGGGESGIGVPMVPLGKRPEHPQLEVEAELRVPMAAELP